MKLPSYNFLIPAAVLMGLAPFAPEPHLFEKLRMLFSGDLSRPIDIFDLFLHGTLPTLLALKVGRDVVGKVKGRAAAVLENGGTPPEAPKTRAQRRREEREERKR